MTLHIDAHRRAAPDTIQPDRWEESAACNSYDSEIFFPHEKNADTVAAAKRVCARCPVIDRCLNDAMTQPTNPDGVWGGYTHDERSKLRLRAGYAHIEIQPDTTVDDVLVGNLMSGLTRAATLTRHKHTAEIDEAIRRLTAARIPPQDIAVRIGTSADAVQQRLYRMRRRAAC